MKDIKLKKLLLVIDLQNDFINDNSRYVVDEIIEKIEKSEWWNWTHEELKERLPDLKNIDEFIKKWC